MPWPRRAASRPATRWRTSVSSPGWRSACVPRTAAIGSTPSNSCGNGSIPASRSDSSLCGAPPAARRRRRLDTPAHGEPRLGGRDVDLGDLEVALARGVVITTSSPRLRPSSALPTGDSLESFISAGLASAEPTIVYLFDLPASSLTCTTEPTRTRSVPRSDWSITVAERSFSSSDAIRASSIACSFLASSYSAFSEMSPNSRASLIRAATSRRRVVVRWSSSALRLASPSGVMMTSLGMSQTCSWGGTAGKQPTVLDEKKPAC